MCEFCANDATGCIVCVRPEDQLADPPCLYCGKPVGEGQQTEDCTICDNCIRRVLKDYGDH